MFQEQKAQKQNTINDHQKNLELMLLVVCFPVEQTQFFQQEHHFRASPWVGVVQRQQVRHREGHLLFHQLPPTSKLQLSDQNYQQPLNKLIINMEKSFTTWLNQQFDQNMNDLLFLRSFFYMSHKKRSLTVQQPSSFRVTVNVSSFQYAKSSLKERTQRKYIPLYWKKCKMDQKHIVPSKEDRLTQLTTTQIDRIIDMEKIRGLLYDRKKKISDQYLESQEIDPLLHNNVYQANFLSKVNEIAIKRGIRKETNDFGEKVKTDENKHKEKQRNTQSVNCKYTKEYATDHRKTERNRPRQAQDQFQKSIQSIKADLDSFEVTLQEKKVSKTRRNTRKSAGKQFKLLPSNRWFYGMSTRLINKNQTKSIDSLSQHYRSDYDIESQIKEIDSSDPTKKVFRRSQHSTNTCRDRGQRRKIEPMGQFKINRIVTAD